MRKMVLLLALIATPAAAADQFDLVCKGGKETMHYRIDLTSGEYCADKCERILKVQEATAGMITLSETRSALSAAPIGYNQINRLTGEWRWFFQGGQNITGKCERAPFSGFPVAKF